MNERNRAEGKSSGVTPVIARNVQALLEQRRAEEENLGWQEKVATAIVRWTGNMPFILAHLIIYSAWVIINLGWIPNVHRFDPTLVMLATEASVEAIFLSTFILIAQNWSMAQSDRRSNLNLQISLLAEHEITRVLSLTRNMAQKMGNEEAEQAELEQLSQNVGPEQVLQTMDEQEKKFDHNK